MEKKESIRDLIMVEDEHGKKLSYEVEALFDMRDETYALLRSEDDDTILMQVEEDEHGQHLVGLSDQDAKEDILDAYEIAVEAAPAE